MECGVEKKKSQDHEVVEDVLANVNRDNSPTADGIQGAKKSPDWSRGWISFLQNAFDGR